MDKPGAVELAPHEVRELMVWLYQLAGFIDASGEIHAPHVKRLIELGDLLKDRADELPCHVEAPFEVTEPQRVTYRPVCTAVGHQYGHSTTVAPGAIIHWRDVPSSVVGAASRAVENEKALRDKENGD